MKNRSAKARAGGAGHFVDAFFMSFSQFRIAKILVSCPIKNTLLFAEFWIYQNNISDQYSETIHMIADLEVVMRRSKKTSASSITRKKIAVMCMAILLPCASGLTITAVTNGYIQAGDQNPIAASIDSSTSR